jgi:predicted dehydrogenase
MEPVRFGLIGLGRHGRRYAAHLMGDVPGARLVAVSRRDEAAGRAFAAQHGLAFHPRYEALLSDPAVEAVAVVVPPDLHEAICLAALRAGRPVLVEKPLAPTLAAARRIAAAAEPAGVPCMVAQTLRFNAVVGALRQRLPGIGPLRTLALNQRFEPSPLPWLDDPGPGGIVKNTGVHGFDLVRHLSGGEVREVLCDVRRIRTRRTEDAFAAILRLEASGVVVTVDGSRVAGGRSGRIEACGEAGQLVGDHVLGTLAEIRGTALTPLPAPPPVATIREALCAFAAFVRGEAPNPIPAAEGVRAMAIVEACLRSAASGRFEPVEE